MESNVPAMDGSEGGMMSTLKNRFQDLEPWDISEEEKSAAAAAVVEDLEALKQEHARLQKVYYEFKAKRDNAGSERERQLWRNRARSLGYKLSRLERRIELAKRHATQGRLL